MLPPEITRQRLDRAIDSRHDYNRYRTAITSHPSARIGAAKLRQRWRPHVFGSITAVSAAPPPRRHRRRRRRRRRQSHRRRPRPRPTPSLTPSGHEHISINAPWLELGYVDSMYTQYRVYPRVLGGAAVPEGLAVALSSSQLEHLLSSSCVADTNQYLFNTESCSDICYYT